MSERSKSRSLGQQVSEASTDITVTKPLLSLLLTPQPLYRKCWGLPYCLFLLLFHFYVSFYPFTMRFFSQTLPLIFSLSNPPSRLFCQIFCEIDSMSRELKIFQSVLHPFHSLSSHVPFSCVIPRIPHLLFQSLFMLPPNSKKSFRLLVLYLLYNWFVLCV